MTVRFTSAEEGLSGGFGSSNAGSILEDNCGVEARLARKRLNHRRHAVALTSRHGQDHRLNPRADGRMVEHAAKSSPTPVPCADDRICS